MCDPATILTAVTTGLGLKQTIDAKNARQDAARRRRREADEQKSQADLQTRTERKRSYDERPSRRSERSPALSAGIFSPRSFFRR